MRLVYIDLFPFCYFTKWWSSGFDAVRSYSSPRATDLNSDGIDDIILVRMVLHRLMVLLPWTGLMVVPYGCGIN